MVAVEISGFWGEGSVPIFLLRRLIPTPPPPSGKEMPLNLLPPPQTIEPSLNDKQRIGGEGGPLLRKRLGVAVGLETPPGAGITQLKNIQNCVNTDEPMCKLCTYFRE